MLIKVTNKQAARILVNGGHVWDGYDAWASCVVEVAGMRAGKRDARENCASGRGGAPTTKMVGIFIKRANALFFF